MVFDFFSGFGLISISMFFNSHEEKPNRIMRKKFLLFFFKENLLKFKLESKLFYPK